MCYRDGTCDANFLGTRIYCLGSPGHCSEAAAAAAGLPLGALPAAPTGHPRVFFRSGCMQPCGWGK